MEIELEKVPSRPGPGNGEEPETVVKPRVRMDELLRRPFDVRSMALTGLFLLAVFYTIYFMRSLLLPIILAWLLSYLLRPFVRALTGIKIPPLIGSG
ncbi:MAG TPA: hypothetical protein VGK72_01910, partial [Chthoniobacterales bacterium]